MFRLLLRTPLCWARQAKKPKAEMDLSEEQEVSTGRGLRSKAKHYQQTKPKLSKIDHEDLQDEEGTEEFKNTMEFFRKMMED
jgi:phage-related protein